MVPSSDHYWCAAVVSVVAINLRCHKTVLMLSTRCHETDQCDMSNEALMSQRGLFVGKEFVRMIVQKQCMFGQSIHAGTSNENKLIGWRY